MKAVLTSLLLLTSLTSFASEIPSVYMNLDKSYMMSCEGSESHPDTLSLKTTGSTLNINFSAMFDEIHGSEKAEHTLPLQLRNEEVVLGEGTSNDIHPVSIKDILSTKLTATKIEHSRYLEMGGNKQVFWSLTIQFNDARMSSGTFVQTQSGVVNNNCTLRLK